MTDRHLWKHYLPATVLACGKNKFTNLVSSCYSNLMCHFCGSKRLLPSQHSHTRRHHTTTQNETDLWLLRRTSTFQTTNNSYYRKYYLWLFLIPARFSLKFAQPSYFGSVKRTLRFHQIWIRNIKTICTEHKICCWSVLDIYFWK